MEMDQCQGTSKNHSAFNSESESGLLKKADELLEIQVAKRTFVCIEYPGVIHNTDKALSMLGGISKLSKDLQDDKKKVQLHFRPADPYCKPAYSSIYQINNLLMRVRRRKKILVSTDAVSHTETSTRDCSGNFHTDSDAYEYKVELLGVIDIVHKFQGMCDFQYLPMKREENGSYQNLLDQLVLKTITPSREYLSREGPLFIPPMIFSRMDTPQDYNFRSDRGHRNVTYDPNVTRPPDVIGSGRKARVNSARFLAFEDKEIPSKPLDTTADEKTKDPDMLYALKQLFEERPIWGKAALCYRLRHMQRVSIRVKQCLPSIAYHFLTGPWRALWVKFGYDPRKDPCAKKYQVVDFRMRQKGVTEELTIGRKRSIYNRFVLPRQASNKPQTMEVNLAMLSEDAEDGIQSKDEPQLKDFEFHPDVLPPNRQIYYQLCDIYDPEIQNLVSKNDGKEQKCDEKNGWCGKNFGDLCRQIMSKHVEKLNPLKRPGISKSLRHSQKKMEKLQQLMDDSEVDVAEDN